MKKQFLLAAVATMSMLSCSKYNDASLSKTSYTLYHSQTENIQGENVGSLDWDSDNEFVATISDGVIEGRFVGRTTVRESSHKLAFNVEVKPKFNLYTEPDMEWGASMETIKSRYGTPYSSDLNSLFYKSSNNNVPYYVYLFENGQLKSSGVVVQLSAGSTLVEFLAERYLAVNIDISKLSAVYTHFYGKVSDPQYDYIVSFAYYSSLGGILVAYGPYTSSNTRTNEDTQVYIENLLIEKGIMVE